MKDARFRDRAVYLPAADAIVLADLHVGRGEASNVQAPLGEESDLRRRLAALLDRFDPAEVVFAGDVLHEFDRATDGAAESLQALVDAVDEAGGRARLIAGNHDPVLSSVWDGEIHDAVALADGTVVCHGHAEPPRSGDRYVIGHDHPAIEIEGQRHPCYLYGPAAYRDRDLLILPAFTRLASGVRVGRLSTGGFRSPLVEDADGLRPIVRDPDSDETLWFPGIGRFRSML